MLELKNICQNFNLVFEEIIIFTRIIKINMEIFRDKKTLTDYIERQKEMGKRIGFAPTMGALHQGHLSLYEIANKENDLVISSIFVNPTQFNNPDDLKKYPRDTNRDLKLLEKTGIVDAVYLPEVEDLYPDGLTSKSFNFDGLENMMEGKSRPGHFDGVGTIVKRLFEIVKPSHAYFGEKDFQQLQIVKKLVSKYEMKVAITGCPIFRETSGLAMISRNERLSPKAREKAALIFEILKDATAVFKTHSMKETVNFVEKVFKKYPEFELEYFEIADEETLLPSENKDENKKYRGFVAVFIEKIRLIDNISLN